MNPQTAAPERVPERAREIDLQRIERVLEELRSALPDVRSAIVSRNDGRPLVHSAEVDDPVRVAAMTASAVGLTKRLIGLFGAGELTETTISGSEGQILLYAAGPSAVLALGAASRANVALINLKARVAAKAVADAFPAR